MYIRMIFLKSLDQSSLSDHLYHYINQYDTFIAPDIIDLDNE